MSPNTHCNLFPIWHFVCTYTHISKSIGCVRMFYISNNSSTIRDVYFLCQSSIQGMNGKLWLQTCITVSLYKPLVCTYIHNLKVPFVHGSSGYWMTALSPKTFVVWFGVAWEFQLESNSPRHASVILWYNIVSVYCKHFHALLFSMQLHMTTQLMYSRLRLYYTPKDGFTANDALFNKNKFG